MKLLNTSLIIEKKSKFYGFLYEIDNESDIKQIIDNLHQEYKNYRHIPYAYKINNTASKSDDKEPGSIGMQILNVLERNNLNSHILLVLRIYGGTKLGAPLLLRTYSKCANNCIK